MVIAARQDCYRPAELSRIDEAIARIGGQFAMPNDEEMAALDAAVDRVLARDINASMTSPPFARSAMDGFAYRFAGSETPSALECIGQTRAGAPFSDEVKPGNCVAIATGAMLPPGCDTVAIREQCHVTEGSVLVMGPVVQYQHVRRQGEDFQAGDGLLAAGMRLTPQHIGLLASAGCFAIPVRRRVKLGVFSVGDELHAGAGVPPGGQIYDANRPMLLALCRRTGAEVSDLGILPDRRGEISSALGRAASVLDVILCSAATSKGIDDNLRAAVQECGGNVIISGIAIKPGKPVSFAQIGNSLVIALPGNPTAALVTFLTMAAPLLRRLSGAAAHRAPVQMVRAGFTYLKTNRLREYLRVTLRDGGSGMAEACHCAKDGAAMLACLAQSDGLVWLSEESTGCTPGDLLPFSAFDSFLA